MGGMPLLATPTIYYNLTHIKAHSSYCSSASILAVELNVLL